MAKPLFGGKTPTPMVWKPLPFMEEFLENMRVDGTTEAYIKAVKLGLSHFALFCATEGIKHPDELERMHILRFQAYLMDMTKDNGDPLSPAYRSQLLKYVRHWINWMARLRHIQRNPWFEIRVSRSEKKPNPLEDDEINALFDAHRKQAFSISPFFYHRRETILVLLYGWGLRVHELASLTTTAMDMRQDFVVCRNKGGGTKTLPYADEMKQIVQRWLVQRAKHALPGEDSLLTDSHGKALSTAMIYKIVTETGVRAGVQINPHRLRDSFGTKLLESDVPVERIMKMMGHTKRAQTLAYARVNDHTLKSSHDAVMNPLLQKLTGGSDGRQLEERPARPTGQGSEPVVDQP